VDECPVCHIPLSVSQREECPSPACPCFGTAIGSAAMERAARSALTRPYSQRSTDPAALLAELETRYADPVEARSHAYVRARSASITAPNLDGAEALARVAEFRVMP
jgi:hypothetical protein